MKAEVTVVTVRSIEWTRPPDRWRRTGRGGRGLLPWSFSWRLVTHGLTDVPHTLRGRIIGHRPTQERWYGSEVWWKPHKRLIGREEWRHRADKRATWSSAVVENRVRSTRLTRTINGHLNCFTDHSDHHRPRMHAYGEVEVLASSAFSDESQVAEPRNLSDHLGGVVPYLTGRRFVVSGRNCHERSIRHW